MNEYNVKSEWQPDEPLSAVASGSVLAELDNLERIIVRAQKGMSILQERLQPLLSDSSPRSEVGVERMAQQPRCELAARVTCQANELLSAVERLESLTDRIALV